VKRDDVCDRRSHSAGCSAVQVFGYLEAARWLWRAVGYLGLDPRSRQSRVGRRVRVPSHISKQGSSAARHVLCYAACVIERCSASVFHGCHFLFGIQPCEEALRSVGGLRGPTLRA
jgi:Transposase IS116/IS110/IS902 family